MTEETRRGDWVTTWRGGRFFPFDPRADEMFIDDIAHMTAHQCRYGGAPVRFYSVAEHAVVLSHAVPPEYALDALLHDAGEAYLPDLPRQVVQMLPDYQRVKEQIEYVVAQRFEVAYPTPAVVKDYDRRICINERDAILAPQQFAWTSNPPPLDLPLFQPGLSVIGLLPHAAANLFLARYYDLVGQVAPVPYHLRRRLLQGEWTD